MNKDEDGISVARDDNGSPEVRWDCYDGEKVISMVFTPEQAMQAARALLGGAMKAYALEEN